MSPLARGGEIKTNPPGITRDRKTLERWARTHPWQALRKFGPLLVATSLLSASVSLQLHPITTMTCAWVLIYAAVSLGYKTAAWITYRDGWREGIKEARFQAMTNWLDTGGTEWRWPPQTKGQE